MRAVVLGGSGFVGKRLVELLAAVAVDATSSSHEDVPEAARAAWPRFRSITTFDRAPYPGALPPGVDEERGDLLDRDALRRVLRGAHTVFHLASVVHVGLSKNPVIERVNVDGTRAVLEVARELGVPFVVYTSSEDVVLDRRPIVHGDESIPYPSAPIHDYVRTKIEGERLALGANGTTSPDGTVLTTCAVRPTHVYGPHDPHAIPTALRELAAGKMPILIGDPLARFDVVYVDNVVHAHLLAAAKLHDPATRAQVAGRAYLINEGNRPNFFDFLRPYAAAVGVRVPRRYLPKWLAFAIADANELLHRWAGIEPTFHRFHLYVIGQDFFFSGRRARDELGYVPLVAPAEAEARTLAWVRTLPLR